MANMSHDELLAYAAMVKRLNEWRDEAQRVSDARDPLIAEAHAGGMSNTQIALNMGLNRGTVITALGSDDEETGQ